jgi:uncharacterized protein (DUF983 family)
VIREPDQQTEPARHEVSLVCPQCQNGLLEFEIREHKVQVRCQWCQTQFVFPSLADWNALSLVERMQ